MQQGQHLADLLEEWLEQTEDFLDGDDAARWEDKEKAGPESEIEYWKRRVQRLTSIDEQIKTKACKNTLVMLTSVTKNASDEFNRSRIFALLRRWKQVDLNLTEAVNEAKDNAKCAAHHHTHGPPRA